MRERVAALGGEFHAGPRPAGGFRVSATLPLAAAPATSGPV
jgi:signal transduction histidine kinase